MGLLRWVVDQCAEDLNGRAFSPWPYPTRSATRSERRYGWACAFLWFATGAVLVGRHLFAGPAARSLLGLAATLAVPLILVMFGGVVCLALGSVAVGFAKWAWRERDGRTIAPWGEELVFYGSTFSVSVFAFLLALCLWMPWPGGSTG